MEDEENNLLKERSEESNLSAEQTHGAIVWGTFFAFVFLFLSRVFRSPATSPNRSTKFRAWRKKSPGVISTSKRGGYDRGDEVGPVVPDLFPNDRVVAGDGRVLRR
jgi:hypothetical protein